MSMPPLELYNQYSVLTVEENYEPISTVTQLIEAVSPPPTAQLPTALKAYPPRPTWENCLRLEFGVQMDLASVSGLLCRLYFCVRYLVMGGGHVVRSEGETGGKARGQ